MRYDTRRFILAIVVSALLTGCGAEPGSSGLAFRTDIAQRAPLPRTEDRGLRGFADFHAHMFSEQAFGAFLFHGQAFVAKPEPDAMAEALGKCQHTLFPHVITCAIVTASGDEPHGPDGYPRFDTWPRYNTHVHQQMYIDWLYRAYRYGLRLVTIVATNSEALCEFAHHEKSCSDSDAVERQIKAIDAMQSWVASNEGGWLRVATSAQEAEDIIRDNRLAIVIGVEVDSLFGCGIGPLGEVCGEADVVERLARYRKAGVRQITPVHLVDNAFGGSAHFDERLNANHFYLRGYYQAVRDCTNEGVQWRLRGKSAVPSAANLLLFVHRGHRYDPRVPGSVVGAAGHCNDQGLTPLGRALVRELMKGAFLIDAEHMSERSLDDTLAMVTPDSYPIMLSHTWFRELKLSTGDLGQDPAYVQDHWNEQRAEMHRHARTLAAVRLLGGVVGVVTNQGYVRELGGSAVPNDCDTSSKSFAQALLHATEQMGSDGVGFGTDMNGFNGQPGPRFGPFACGGGYANPGVRRRQEEAQRTPLKYDSAIQLDGKVLTRSVAGRRYFDFNTMGLAHYGMIPDLIADLQGIGVPPATVEVLYRSAAAYVAMWKRAEARARALGGR